MSLRLLQPDSQFALHHRQHVHGHPGVELQTTVGGQPNPFVGLGVARNPNGAFSTQLSGTWDTFYAAKRSSATRRRDRTKLKKLSEIGEVALVEPRAADERAATLETLMTQKGKAFAAMGVANIFERPGHREFYRSLVANESMQDQVHVSRLDVGSATAAVNVALVFRGSYYHLLASYFDGEVARFGPGAAHLHHLMRHAISRGYQVFDFTIGDEPYKRDWSDTEIRLFDHVSAVTLRGWPAALQDRKSTRLNSSHT